MGKKAKNLSSFVETVVLVSQKGLQMFQKMWCISAELQISAPALVYRGVVVQKFNSVLFRNLS